MDGDKVALSYVFVEAANGPFGHLTNAKTREIGSSNTDLKEVSYVIPVNYWSLTACGITYGSTTHPEPPVTVYLSGYPSLSAIQTALKNAGYYEVQFPWILLGQEGLVFAKTNTQGYGGCTDGEFRDQNFIYTTPQNVNNQWYDPVLSQMQVNEPNPDLFSYDAPTFWWDVYVAAWHLAN